ncbi:hypothetical protein GXW82_20800 [Streptacidiphilus sp. 4-A2]|nr:hypothetical protein [Streptacidiphilus sp. 4-A2]
MLALAVALVAAGGLGGAVLYNTTGRRSAVLALAHNVTAGQSISAADLVIAHISLDPSLQPVGAASLENVVGMRATTDLMQGQFLTTTDVTRSSLVQAGQQVIGLPAKDSQLPAAALQPGNQVMVVSTGTSSAGGSGGGSTSGGSVLPPVGSQIAATVVTVGAADNDGTTVVDVAVPSAQAPQLAVLAASGGFAVVFAPRAAAEMALFAIVGGHGAPGATVTALAMLHAWPLQSGGRVLLAECDPDGVILSGALEGRLDASRGLGQLGVADRQGQLAQTLMTQLTDVSPGGTADRLLLPGVSDPAQYSGLAYVWESLANLLAALEGQGVDVLVDLGRSGAAGPSAVLARRADAVLVVARSTLRSLTTTHPRIAALRADLNAHGRGADTLGLVLVEEGPYKAADVSAQLGSPVLGLLPYAPAVAGVLSDGGNTHDRRFVRSPLLGHPHRG